MFRTRRQAAFGALCMAPLTLVTVGSIGTSAGAAPQVVARTVAAWSDVTDPAGQVWKSRRGLIGGSSVATELVGKDVLGTTDDALYRVSTFSSTDFAVPVAAGRYRVRLLMAEGYYTRAGQRVFDVTAEGAPALSRVDIAGAVGRGTAYDRDFEVDVTDGTLNVAFVRVVDNPLIAAIEVTLVPPIVPPTTTTTTTVTTTSATTTTQTATTSPTTAPSPSNATTSTIPTTSTSPPTSTSPTGSTTSATSPSPVARVVARSVAAYRNVIDAQGNVWKARYGFVGQELNSRSLANTDIAGTTDDVLYRELTFGTTGYSVPLPSGRYQVRLLMAEDYYSTAGKRVFDVTAQGLPVLRGVDIAAAVGRAAAYDRTFAVDVTTGALNLQFVAVADRPEFAAIEVSRVGDAAPPSTTSAPTTSTTSVVPTTPPVTSSTTSVVPTTPPVTSSTTSVVPTTATTTPPVTSTSTPPVTTTTTTPPVTTTTAPVLVSDGTAPVPLGVGSPWITRVENAPLDPLSETMAANLRADVVNNWGGIAAFNSNHYNTSYYRVPAGQPRVDVTFVDCQNKQWVDPNLFTGPAFFKNVPIPADAQPARGTDAALTIYDPSTDQVWDFWQAKKNAVTGAWEACWGGRIDNVSSSMGIFPRYYGATGTGVALAAGMIGVDEVRRGSIDHAMYLGVMNAQAHPVMSWPALRTDGHVTDPNVVREGQRLRLDPSLDLNQLDLTPVGRMVARAAQRYGFVVSDRSGSVAVITEAGLREQALTGTDPWWGLLGQWQPYEVLRNFPWDKIQIVEADWGKPTDPVLATPTPVAPTASPTAPTTAPTTASTSPAGP